MSSSTPSSATASKVSGLDPERGEYQELAIEATATLTLALPKAGLMGAPRTGELYLADISIPDAAYKKLGIDVEPLFRDSPILRIDSR